MGSDNDPSLSIIIPVYNVEEYLRQCLESVLSQDFHDFEVIIVDDGSTDSCPAICDSYSESDERVLVIHKENGGLSDARNAGVYAARGRYLLFIDGDDFIAGNSLAKIVQALERDGYPDILFLNALLYYEDGRIEPYGYGFERECFYGKSKAEVLSRLSRGGQFHVSACVKAVKREFINKFNIRFTKGIIGEDVDFSIHLYLNADTYGYLGATYYYYRQNRGGSIMSQKTGKRYQDLIYIVRTWAARADGENEERRELILRFLFHQYYILVALYRDLDKYLKTKQIRADIKRFSYLLKYTDNKKAWLLYVFYLIFGINASSHLVGFFRGPRQAKGLLGECFGGG